MGTAELSRAVLGQARLGPTPIGGASTRAAVRSVLSCALVLLAVTALAFLVAYAAPELAPSARPHPALRPTVAVIASILVNNARVLAAPFVLAAFRFARSLRGRVAGDVVTAAILGGNALRIGLALGRWRGTLIPYLPQLPLEYLAASAAAGAWIDARRRASADARPSGRATSAYGITTLTFLVAAAVVEVLLTPHAR